MALCVCCRSWPNHCASPPALVHYFRSSISPNGGAPGSVSHMELISWFSLPQFTLALPAGSQSTCCPPGYLVAVSIASMQ